MCGSEKAEGELYDACDHDSESQLGVGFCVKVIIIVHHIQGNHEGCKTKEVAAHLHDHVDEEPRIPK